VSVEPRWKPVRERKRRAWNSTLPAASGWGVGRKDAKAKPRKRLKSRPHRTDPAVVEAVARRAHGLCEARLDGCNGLMEHPHHRLLRKHGGPDTLACLVAVCWQCHRRIHDNPAESYRLGLLVRNHSAEADALRAAAA